MRSDVAANVYHWPLTKSDLTTYPIYFEPRFMDELRTNHGVLGS